MTRTRKIRLSIITISIVLLFLVTFLILYALNQNINLYFTPQQIVHDTIPTNRQIRLGGMVVAGSVQRFEDLTVKFVVTDFAETLKVEYKGILPDLFREGQGVVALGKVQNGIFVANQILAKHDENYMPPEVLSSLKKE